MNEIHRRRRVVVVLLFCLGILFYGVFSEISSSSLVANKAKKTVGQSAVAALEDLAVKGRAPKTGYARTEFGNGWRKTGNCDTRNDILARDMQDVKTKDCKVISGKLADPYTAKIIYFERGPGSSTKVQIDHVVALSDAWQKGAQYFSSQTRENLANDPLELLAVDGPANQDKGDGDAATWLPPNKAYRCRYVARQIAVKQKYDLWVTSAEKNAISRVLSACPGQLLPEVTS